MRKLLLMLLVVLPFISSSQTRHVVSNHLNFRTDSSLNSDIISVLQYKDQLDVILEGDTWLKISYNDTIGYVWNSFTVDDFDIIEYHEQHLVTGAVCADSTIQLRISSNPCKYHRGVKSWINTSYAYKNGKKLFPIRIQ